MAAKRKMPVKTVTLDFGKDGYEGFTAETRTNSPVGLIRQYIEMSADGTEDEARTLLLKLFPSWDFVDDDGKPIPHTAEGFDFMPPDLVRAMQRRRAEALQQAAMPGPLGSDSSATAVQDTTDSPTP